MAARMSGPLPPIRSAQPAASAAGADVYERGPDGRTRLMAAAAAGDARLCAQLLDRGADPAAVDRAGCTAMFYALSAGHVDAALRLLESPSPPAQVLLHPAPWRALHRAAQLGDIESARRLIQDKAGYSDRKGGLARYSAAVEAGALSGGPQLLKLLLEAWPESRSPTGPKEARAVVRATAEGGSAESLRIASEWAAEKARGRQEEEEEEKGGETALHGAALAGRIQSVRALVEAGQDPMAGSAGLGTPLECAARRGHLDVLKYLDERIAADELEGAGAARRAALAAAAGRGHLEACRYLLVRLGGGGGGAFQHEDGRPSPLAAAAAGGHADVLQLLLSSGLDLVPVRVECMYRAAERGRLDVIRMLAAAGVSVRSKFRGGQGGAPLHAAAAGGHAACVQLLLELGARPSAHDACMATPLHAALATYTFEEKSSSARRKSAADDEPVRHYSGMASPDGAHLAPDLPPENTEWLVNLVSHGRRDLGGAHPAGAAAVPEEFEDPGTKGGR
eukprot:tig00000042_g15600.t1